MFVHTQVESEYALACIFMYGQNQKIHKLYAATQLNL